MPLPNFLVIGAGKCGTTSLYHYLKQHPEIFMSPEKEPNFLGYDPDQKPWNGPIQNIAYPVKSLSEYQKLFENVRDEKAIGEASPSTFSKQGCKQVLNYLPQARLICIMRQPVDASYSLFLHRRRMGIEPESDFRTAYSQWKWRREQNWAPMLIYRRVYHNLLKYWLSFFPREQFRFYLTDDLKRDPLALMQDLFQFLEVDNTFKPDTSTRANPAYEVRNHSLRELLRADSAQPVLSAVLKKMVPRTLRQPIRKKIMKWNQAPAQPLDRQTRNELTRDYEDDILKTQDLIGRDLSLWLKEI